MPERWQNRPDGSNWGDFGPDDQVGRLNLLTAEQVLKGVAEVRTGRTFCLSLPLDYPGGNAVNPKRHPPQLRPTLHEGRVPYYNMAWAEHTPGLTDVSADDAVVLHTQYSTQWDSLAHVGSMFDADGDGTPERVYYNGWRAGSDIPDPDAEGRVGAHALGIDTIAATCVQGRGVLVDLHAHHGDARVAVDRAELGRILEADGVVVEPGDILVLHTGWSQLVLDMGKRPDASILHTSCPVLDSRDPTLLEWVADSGVVAIAADNFAVEEAHKPLPPGAAGSRLPLHELCLFKLGIPLGELWYLTELAAYLRAEGRSRFLLTAPPLRLTGAVGSPVTPVATV
ncbi:cyclase family protein [Acuticoccus sp.]|uniref:cyclase family protein n=1 Tax=Acuticoccus sp. TaxID=1904378 RepID=UPI003B52BC39